MLLLIILHNRGLKVNNWYNFSSKKSETYLQKIKNIPPKSIENNPNDLFNKHETFFKKNRTFSVTTKQFNFRHTDVTANRRKTSNEFFQRYHDNDKCNNHQRTKIQGESAVCKHSISHSELFRPAAKACASQVTLAFRTFPLGRRDGHSRGLEARRGGRVWSSCRLSFFRLSPIWRRCRPGGIPSGVSGRVYFRLKAWRFHVYERKEVVFRMRVLFFLLMLSDCSIRIYWNWEITLVIIKQWEFAVCVIRNETVWRVANIFD